MGEARAKAERVERRKEAVISLAENLYIAATCAGRHNAETPYTPSSAFAYAEEFLRAKEAYLAKEEQ